MSAGRGPKNGAMNKDAHRLVTAALNQGWTIGRRGNKHWRLDAPDGVTIVTVSCSPSDRRSYLNFRAQLRRGGLKV